MKDKKSKVVLSKKAGWILLVILVILDAFLDLIFTGGAGLQSPIWKPISNFLKINNPLFLTPFVLIIFNFGLFKSHYYLIPILIVIALIYSLWAEKKLKK